MFVRVGAFHGNQDVVKKTEEELQKEITEELEIERKKKVDE